MATVKQFSIGGAVGIAIGLIGTGIQWKWPEYKNVGVGLIGVGALILLIAVVAAFVRSLTIREYERLNTHRQITQMDSPHTRDVLAQAQAHSNSEAMRGGVQINVGTIQQNAENIKQIQETLARKSYSQPDIEFTNPVIRTRWIKAYEGLVKENPEPDTGNATALSVMLARLYYKDEFNVPPEIKVTAKISIADATGKPIKARYDGAWDEFTDSEYRRFATAQTRELVVALMPVVLEARGIMTWGFGRNANGFDPDREILTGDKFWLAVELIGKYEGEIILRKPLKLTLTIEPPDLQLEWI